MFWKRYDRWEQSKNDNSEQTDKLRKCTLVGLQPKHKFLTTETIHHFVTCSAMHINEKIGTCEVPFMQECVIKILQIPGNYYGGIFLPSLVR